MSRPRALLLLAALAHCCAAQHLDLCDLPYCDCNPALHPSWTTVSCTVPKHKRLDILEGDLPNTTTELVISGAEAVLFDVNSLSRLSDIRHIRIEDAKMIMMRKFTAVNLNIVSILFEVDRCDTLRLEEKTFTNIKGPVSMDIKNCDYVSLESEAFSWLLSLSVSDVKKLQLSPGAFVLDPTAANVGEHGPGMAVELKNLAVSEFTSQTFGSSAAQIVLESITVDNIFSDAFSANTYNTVIAINCSFHHIHAEAFAQKSLINNLLFQGCNVHKLASSALQSAVTKLNITHSTFENIETGAINITVATVIITDSIFNNFYEKGFQLTSCNKFRMERNSFDELAANAIIAPGASIHELVFIENEMEAINENSLGFIGQAYLTLGDSMEYKNNYYGQACHCGIVPWLGQVLGAESGDSFASQSFCTISEFFAKCFHVPEQNMLVGKFVAGVCSGENNIKCLPYKIGGDGQSTEIKNPRFPHTRKEKETLSDRDKKIIGIVIVTALGCVVLVMLISFIRWLRRRGYCQTIKNFLVTSSSCSSLCEHICSCQRNRNGLDSAGSISQIAIHEYSERRRLNEPPRVEIQETVLPRYSQEMIPTDNKMTQTMPAELSKELLENLKNKLNDPDMYMEAREMIEHLYELVKVEDSCHTNTPVKGVCENIYELPFQNTMRVGRNKKQMRSVGTLSPTLDELSPVSLYNRKTALAHEYFEPKDLAIHLYAEIANNERDRKALLSAMPDVVGEQAAPRGPYLAAVRGKQSSSSSSSSPSESSSCSLLVYSPPLKQRVATIKADSSSSSNSPAKMINRPLPEKPTTTFDPGEGTSSKLN